MRTLPKRHSVVPKRTIFNMPKPSPGSTNGKPGNSSENSMDEMTGFSMTGKSRFQGPKSEKRKSLKLGISDGRKSIIPKRNYMSLQSEELEDRDIVGTRKSLALSLQSNVINVGIVILIITYGLFTFIITAIDKNTGKDHIMIVYHSVESIFILAFVIEILVYKYAFRELYF